MDEWMVVDLFLIVRVMLLGGIAMWFPRITRKGLFFGVYVGEGFFDGDGKKPVLRAWDRGVWLLMALALLTGFLFTLDGNAVAGNLTGTALILVGLGLWFVVTHRRVRNLPAVPERPTAATASAALIPDTHGAEGWTRNALIFVVVLSLATGMHAALGYGRIPDQVPWLPFPFHGGSGPFRKSLVAILYPSAANLVVSSLFALLGLMTATAKRSIRAGGGDASVAAQNAFRAKSARLFSVLAVMISLILATYSMGVVGALGAGREPNWLVLLVMGLMMVVYMAVNLFLLMGRVGQGGAHLEGAPVEGRLSGGLVDESAWRWGLFYHNPEDPSLMVETRFGFGYTMNSGNPTARAFTWGYLALLAGLLLVPFLM